MTAAPAPACGEAIARIAAWARASGLVFLGDGSTGSGAVFSPCGSWRYLLWRSGNLRGKFLGMGLLNPSKADHAADDPTIRRCRALASRARLSGVLVWNLFALRATDPAELKSAASPVGRHNDAAIGLALGLCRRNVLAWGNHGCHQGRNREVLALCLAAGAGLEFLELTARGEPRHPLYLPATVGPRRWRPEA